MGFVVVEGDLLDQSVEAIVNPWNRNTIPWWLLLPQGVSGAIKRRAGIQPFRELAQFGRLKIGQAVSTSAGRLAFARIIHVAGINDFWRASEVSIRESVSNAITLADSEGLSSVAFPILGAGSGGFDPEKAQRIMLEELARIVPSIEVHVVRFTQPRRGRSV